MGEANGVKHNTAINLYGSEAFSHWKEYERLRPPYPNKLYDTMFEYINQHNHTGGQSGVDYGSGSGHTIHQLFERCHMQNILATDLNEKQLDKAKDTLKPTYGERFDVLVGAAGELTSIPDQSVDFVTTAEACHWFDRVKWLTEAARILKPSGTFAFWNYPPQPYIISHPDAALACNKAFEALFKINRDTAKLSPYQCYASVTLLDNVLVDPKLFSHQVRYKWLVPESITQRLDRDAGLAIILDQDYPDEEARAGLLQVPDTKLIVSTPETAGETFVQYQNWTTKHLIGYMETLGVLHSKVLEDEDFKASIESIEDVVGGPDGTFDVGWPLGLVLATRI